MPIETRRTGLSRRALRALGAAGGVVGVTVILAVGVREYQASAVRAAREEGRKLFAGETPLTGTIVGHEEPLPADTVRCANCHERGVAPRPSPAASASGSALDPALSLGSPLDRASLTGKVPRRGGPPSAYQSPAFCRVLREGIDPVNVMIPQTMPRYAMTDVQCEALWTFLTAP